MQRITVRPNLLRTTARELRQAAAQLEATLGRAHSAFERLDWETRRSSGAAVQVQQARTVGRNLSADAIALATSLERTAAAFEAADRAATDALAKMVAPAALGVAILPQLRWPLQPVPATRLVPMPSKPIGSAPGRLQPMPSPLSPGQNSPSSTVPQPAPAGPPTGLVKLPPTLADRVPYVSQLGTGWNNCGPASYAMVLQYYGKNVDVSNLKGVFPRVGGPDSYGYIDSEGLPTGDVIEQQILGPHDLHNERVQLSADLSEVRRHLDDGNPVIMVIDNQYIIHEEHGRKLPYPETQIAKHIVVVTGVETDSSGAIVSVTINDPLAQKPILDPQGAIVGWEPDPDVGRNFRVPGPDFLQAMYGVNPNLDRTSAVVVLPGRKS
jgi:uncharacterized protein YukE